MQAILAWFASHLLAGVVGELFKKAAIFITFNIVLSFILNYITTNSFSGLSVFGVGASLSSLLGQLADPRTAYVLDCFYVVQGLFLVLNAYLARFAYRLTLRALGAS